jgi:aerobic carbon-monoxide dehydrogenase medium subunit
MIPFELHSPTTLNEAFDLLERYGDDARALSGGTALILLMQQRLARPEHLVSLARIPELHQVDANGSLKIGAGVRHQELVKNAQVKQGWPLLNQTYSRVATVRIRNMATVGGGLAHADPNQDPPAMYIALDAKVGVASKRGTRELSIEELMVGYYETSLEPGEVITHVSVPKPARPLKTAYLKFLPRTEDDYATVAVAVAMDVENGVCRDVRIALNAANSFPVHATTAEDVLRGQRLTPELMREAAATVPALCDPIGDHRGSANYKRRMAEVFVRRALEQASA